MCIPPTRPWQAGNICRTAGWHYFCCLPFAGLNPDELVWADLKAHGTDRKLITSLMQLRQTIRAYLLLTAGADAGGHWVRLCARRSETVFRQLPRS
jgi:hypothetical protein